QHDTSLACTCFSLLSLFCGCKSAPLFTAKPRIRGCPHHPVPRLVIDSKIREDGKISYAAVAHRESPAHREPIRKQEGGLPPQQRWKASPTGVKEREEEEERLRWTRITWMSSSCPPAVTARIRSLGAVPPDTLHFTARRPGLLSQRRWSLRRVASSSRMNSIFGSNLLQVRKEKRPLQRRLAAGVPYPNNLKPDSSIHANLCFV
ncbi:hypothetical protein GOODEAATRI_030785, partial [Goodea atripinnis]